MVVSNIFYFHPYLGKVPILTNIFQMGWNHQLDKLPRFQMKVVDLSLTSAPSCFVRQSETFFGEKLWWNYQRVKVSKKDKWCNEKGKLKKNDSRTCMKLVAFGGVDHWFEEIWRNVFHGIDWIHSFLLENLWQGTWNSSIRKRKVSWRKPSMFWYVSGILF